MTQVNFAMLDFCYSPWISSLTIVTETNYPAHLTLYYTDTQPLKHRTSITLRGATLPWGSYWCFVAYKTIEQSEAGDTWLHTFDIPGLKLGDKIWWATLGSVMGADSPSHTPIISYTHPGGPSRNLYLYPDGPGNQCRIPWQTGLPCPNHWENIDEWPPDYMVSLVSSEFAVTTPYWYDLYSLTPPIVGNIGAIAVSVVWRRYLGMAYVRLGQVCLRTHGRDYFSAKYTLPTSWKTTTWTHYTNPFTGDPWTQTELDDLEIGVAMRMYWGVGWKSICLCTSVRAIITLGNCIPEPIPGPYP